MSRQRNYLHQSGALTPPATVSELLMSLIRIVSHYSFPSTNRLMIINGDRLCVREGDKSTHFNLELLIRLKNENHLIIIIRQRRQRHEQSVVYVLILSH